MLSSTGQRVCQAGVSTSALSDNFNLHVQNGPAVSLYLTLFGIVAGFVSTFWSFGYTRLARRLRGYLEGGLRRVRKNDVVYTLQNGCWINILGIISTLLGLQVGHMQAQI